MLDGEKPDEVGEEAKCIVESLRIFETTPHPGGSRSPLLLLPKNGYPGFLHLVSSEALFFISSACFDASLPGRSYVSNAFDAGNVYCTVVPPSGVRSASVSTLLLPQITCPPLLFISEPSLLLFLAIFVFLLRSRTNRTGFWATQRTKRRRRRKSSEGQFPRLIQRCTTNRRASKKSSRQAQRGVKGEEETNMVVKEFSSFLGAFSIIIN